MPRLSLVSQRLWRLVVAMVIAAFFVWGWRATAPPAEGRIAGNVFVGNILLGGLTVPAAEQIIQMRLDEIESRGWTFAYQGKSVVIKPISDPTDDPDVARNLADIDVSATVQRAYAAGRVWRLTIRRPSIVIPAVVSLHENEIIEDLRANFLDLERPVIGPTFVLNEDASQLMVIPEVSGQHLDQRVVLAALQNSLERLETPTIALTITTERAAATTAEATALLAPAQNILAKLPLQLHYEDSNWELGVKEILPYLTVAKNNDQWQLGLLEGFRGAILESIYKEVLRPVASARFKMENGRVSVWQPPLDGRELNYEETTKRVTDWVNSDDRAPIELAVKIEPAPSLDGEGRDLGIKEIVGVGKSNFKGSPKNRRHNIKVGADTLNGILIAPNEEFSLVKALGDIDASTGYLPELVIKGDRTIPEFGGGLCQIGTTTFRAALASGLPILERQNHSYRVRYYEPAGTDATIYSPKPDFRFLNDTGHSILIQTKIKGDDLIFEFWGTKDGRQISQTTPRIYNIKKPSAKKIIETTELPVGQEKCTEKAHDGADTDFTYIVVYPDGVKKESVFKSHYRPWQEVCLLGVKELTTPSAAVTPPIENNSAGVPGADSPAAVTP